MSIFLDWLMEQGYLLVIGGIVVIFGSVWLLGLALSAFFDTD